MLRMDPALPSNLDPERFMNCYYYCVDLLVVVVVVVVMVDAVVYGTVLERWLIVAVVSVWL